MKLENEENLSRVAFRTNNRLSFAIATFLIRLWSSWG